jgi:hypothetical protein
MITGFSCWYQKASNAKKERKNSFFSFFLWQTKKRGVGVLGGAKKGMAKWVEAKEEWGGQRRSSETVVVAP